MTPYFNISCLQQITALKTWNEARMDCQRNGGDLIRVDDTDERKKHFFSRKNIIITGQISELKSTVQKSFRQQIYMYYNTCFCLL